MGERRHVLAEGATDYVLEHGLLDLSLRPLAAALGTSDRVALAAFIDGIDRWIGEKLRTDDANANLPRLARLAEVWEKIIRAARDTESYNLERKPLVFSVFGMLAEATR